MRVLVVHNRYRNTGGEDTVFHAEVSAMRKRGIEVLTQEFSNRDIPAGLDLTGQARLAARTVWSREAARTIGTTVAAQRIDITHFHNTFPLVSPAAYRAAREAGSAVVQTLHNFRPICANALLLRDGRPCEECVGRRLGWPGVLHGCYQGSRAKTATIVAMQSVHRVARTWQREVDRYIALTQFQRDRFVAAGFPPDRIVVRPNFVDFDVPPEPEVRRGVLFVGQLAEHKGLRVLLDAWERLPPPECGLTIVGDGPMRAELEGRATSLPSVRLTGQLDPPQVHRLMRDAELLVLPSLWYEGLPMVMLEAFACGTPVVASRIGALPEFVEDGRTGFLFTPGDADELAERIRDALEAGPALRNAVDAHEFDVDQAMEQLLGIYSEVVDQRVGGSEG